MATIMIVDDETDSVTVTKRILEKEGYSIITASGGDECLEKLKNGEKPDLILMDIMMPGTPVKDIVPKIKGSKIIYLSSVGIDEEEKKKLNIGNVVGFINKPYEIKGLIDKVKKALT